MSWTELLIVLILSIFILYKTKKFKKWGKAMENKNYIYLDNASSTKTDERAIEEMMPFIRDFYGNPSSVHQAGADSRDCLLYTSDAADE